MRKLQPVRGTKDLLGSESLVQRYVINTAQKISERYGYEPIETPVFEFTDVFKRTLGNTSDIVTKEMYTFEDKGGDSLTLRPEGTAGIARAMLSDGLLNQTPLKWYYSGPMFRHERPQKGRLRQFHQVGVELIGIAEPVGDIEVIDLARAYLDELGVLPFTNLEINTLGDSQSRSSYREVLVSYLEDYRSSLSMESQSRLDLNPLRILDSKNEEDKNIICNAPPYTDYLNYESESFFNSVIAGLEDLDIPYKVNPRLVRGLDYYCHTAFEFTTTRIGSQGTVLAGGRYDNLITMMGGNSTPGIGWAAGVERLAMLADFELDKRRAIIVIGIGAAGERLAVKLAKDLRQSEFKIELNYRGGLKRGLRRANKIGAAAAVFIGDEELSRQSVTLRNLDDGSQTEVNFSELKNYLQKYF